MSSQKLHDPCQASWARPVCWLTRLQRQLPLTLAVLATTSELAQLASCSVNPTKPNKISNLDFVFWVWALLATWSSLLIWSHFEFKFSGMMTFIRLLLVLCAVPPPSNSIKCFTCIGSVSVESCLWTRSQRDRFSFSSSSTSGTRAWAPSVRERKNALQTSTTANSGSIFPASTWSQTQLCIRSSLTALRDF